MRNGHDMLLSPLKEYLSTVHELCSSSDDLNWMKEAVEGEKFTTSGQEAVSLSISQFPLPFLPRPLRRFP